MTNKETALMFIGILAACILFACAGRLSQRVDDLRAKTDPTVNNCPYEGNECPNAQAALKGAEYTITLNADYTVTLKDAVDGRVVVTVDTDSCGKMGDAIWRDNE